MKNKLERMLAIMEEAESRLHEIEGPESELCQAILNYNKKILRHVHGVLNLIEPDDSVSWSVTMEDKEPANPPEIGEPNNLTPKT